MTGGFEADVHRLAARAGEFDTLGERAGEISADLDGALRGAEAAWGDDAVGASFAAAHGGPAGETADVVRGLAGGLRKFGGSVREAARRYHAVDAEAGKSIGETAAGD
ncbi:MAG TPA: PE domain-containing protein [Amycolatopsis sp.]|nr:PE domain-containing protein [Amycolatopsis sp.]